MSPRVPPRQPGPRAMPIRRRTALLSGLALPLGLLTARSRPATVPRPTPSPRLTLPAPTGHHRTGTVSLHLVDPSRPDPWVPTQRVRELMIQLWYPAHAVDDYPRAPYFTPITARAYEKEQGLPALSWPVTAAHLGAPVHQREGGWPTVLYSHSLGGERSETTSLVEDLASHGYVVVTIDHVHDAGVVELPDGRVETIAVPPPTEDKDTPLTTKEIVSRVADVRFVLDQLAVINRGGNPDREHRPLPPGLRGALDLGRTGMFGQSDGGSTTAHAMHADARITAGVNLDGTLWTPQAVAGSGRPLLLFGRQDLDPFEAATWAEFWTKQRGPKLWLNLKGSKHGTFTDFAPLVPQVAPILGKPPSWVIEGIGTINGLRAVAVQRAYIGAYFDTYLRHHDSSLLSGPSPRYPEVVFAHQHPVPSRDGVRSAWPPADHQGQLPARWLACGHGASGREDRAPAGAVAPAHAAGADRHHRTGTVSLHLVDPSRPDPWVPSQRVRELLIQLWYPAHPHGHGAWGSLRGHAAEGDRRRGGLQLRRGGDRKAHPRAAPRAASTRATRAWWIETVINCPRDLACNARLPNLAELLDKARAINRRILEAERAGKT